MIFGIRIYTPDINESVVGDRFPVTLLLKPCPDGSPDLHKYKQNIALSKTGFVSKKNESGARQLASSENIFAAWAAELANLMSHRRLSAFIGGHFHFLG
jgi:hypothetical protein